MSARAEVVIAQLMINKLGKEKEERQDDLAQASADKTELELRVSEMTDNLNKAIKNTANLTAEIAEIDKQIAIHLAAIAAAQGKLNTGG